MWLGLACGSALFAGITAILAKMGIKNTDSTLATAIRTAVVLLFSWLLVFLTGAAAGIDTVGVITWLFLILSGIATGASWLCYFKALHLGDVNQVAPVDKSSTVLTILLAFLLLGEPITLFKGIGAAVIAAGTWLMAAPISAGGSRAPVAAKEKAGHGWFLFAALSAIFASLTSILGKIGIEGVDSNLGTAVRTAVVLVMAWMMVLISGKQREIRKIDGKSWIFILLSGITTGLSWLCYYKALQEGPASVVVPIDKLSILVTVAFSRIFLKEKLTAASVAGLALITAGTLVLLLP